MKKGAQPSSRKNENALNKALGILKAWKIKKMAFRAVGNHLKIIIPMFAVLILCTKTAKLLYNQYGEGVILFTAIIFLSIAIFLRVYLFYISRKISNYRTK